MLNIHALKAFEDNYIWVLEGDSDFVVVDPGDAKPVIEFAKSSKKRLSSVLITHHHFDHTGGISLLHENFENLRVIGPNNPKIKGLTEHVAEGDSVVLPELKVEFTIFEVPGHTLDHIAFYKEDVLFCGDTVFSCGCGRMFEGDPNMFWQSLSKIKALPANTLLYCTHEYTAANVKFAVNIDRKNSTLHDYQETVTKMRQRDQITLPVSLSEQMAINPFLRCDQADFANEVAEQFELSNNDAVSVFAAIRRAKDNF